MKNFFLSLTGLLLCALTVDAQLSTGRAEKFNDNWSFSLEAAMDTTVNPAATDYDASSWRSLSLPHDWSIELLPSPDLNASTGFFPGGIGWYRKSFSVTDSLPVHYLYFEGIYNRSDIYLNGRRIGGRPNGYISHYYDISPYLVEGENTLAVRVDHSREADSRWYTGSGIYRDVWLIGDNATHFTPWGLGWKAGSITPHSASVDIEFATVSPTKEPIEVEATITDPQGLVVASDSIAATAGEAGKMQLTISSPKLWDVDTPHLYRLEVKLIENGEIVDTASCNVGLRTLRFDPDEGFFLNDKNMKVKGVCLHHDAGVLGAVVPKDVWRRRLKNLKALGVNAIRMSHNPQAPDLYDLCDELGFLVMDEASDEWEFPKRKWVTGWNVGTPKFEGSYDFFEEWIDRDVADMVRRDRNHPSVAFWSIGNEVDYPNDPYSHEILDSLGAFNQHSFGGYDPKAPSAMRIGEIAQRLAPIVRSIDDSRPVTGALAGVVMSNQTAYPDAVDIVGYNYTEDRYDIDHKAYPNRVIYGSENSHSYDAWLAVRDNPHIFGQFLWTGTDYLGESNPWPSRGLGTGLLDFGSFPKPRGKFRASLWLDTPVAFLGSYPKPSKKATAYSIDAPDVWDYKKGEKVRVVCYTNQPSARLKLNGKTIGITSERHDGMFAWDLPFAPGMLTVEALDADGNVMATDTLRTTGRPAALRASSDVNATHSNAGIAQGQVGHVTVEIVDDEGNRITLADNLVTCEISNGTLLGLEGTGNTDMSHPRATSRKASGGRVLAYVTPATNSDTTLPILLTFTSPGLSPVTIELPLAK